MNDKELYELIDDLIEQTISESNFLRLEAEMIVHPKARKAYLDRVALVQSLSSIADQMEQKRSQAANPQIVRVESMQRWRAALAKGLALAASVALLGVLTMNLWQKDSSVAEPKASGFAVLANQLETVWDKKQLQKGDLIPSGSMRLLSGIAQIELFSGVTLVMDGEAEFEVMSPMEVRWVSGKIRAQVPEPAHGFRIRTAQGDVVDLGTEFALDVTDQKSELHVLDGAVEWHPEKGDMRLMKQGQAMLAKDGSPTQDLTANAAAFPGITQIQQRENAVRDLRRQAWQREKEQLARDPRLVAFYSFDTSEASRRLPNLAAGEGRPGPAAIVAAAGTEDRWGQSHGALDFSPTGSRVRLNVPGTHASLTMMCWVRINSLDRLFNSLFLTDGHDLGAPHWQLTNDGRLFFSVKKFDRLKENKHNFYSPPIWDSSVAGQWTMLAVVYDVKAKRVTHFVNGEPVGSESIPDDFLVSEVRIGNACIGNWSEPVYRTDPQFTVRNLNGSIDEFAMFSAVLSENEIADIYSKGKP